MVDKNEIVIEYLMNCPIIQENPLFFNFADVEGGNNHIITKTDKIEKHYVDGSCLKRYTFTIACYHSIAHNPLVGVSDFKDENIENMALVQKILDWINEQNDIQNYPDFGENIVIDKLQTLSIDPDLDGIDVSVNPPIARYSIGVQIDYIDNTKRIWN